MVEQDYMAEFTQYKSVKILDRPPHGDGGIVLNENFRALAALAEYHVHEQSVPSMTWTIQHNLARPVQVTLVESPGNEVIVGDLEMTDLNTVTAKFTKAITGKAYAR